MDGVIRFDPVGTIEGFEESEFGKYVFSSDFDAALARHVSDLKLRGRELEIAAEHHSELQEQLAALREELAQVKKISIVEIVALNGVIRRQSEELAQFDQAMRALACNLGSGGYNAEFLTADQLANKIQWGIDNLLKVEQQRLTAAEQRNAELMSMIGDAFERLVCITPRNKPSGVLKQQAMEILQGADIKPTESGASE